MEADGKLDKERRAYIEDNLEEWVSDSKYILMNLGVHLGMGFFRFTALPFPLPIGSTLRGLWVMGCRMYCNLRLDWHRKKVHSLFVLGFAIIPFLGYFAYTIPLRRKSEYLTYLYAQHVSYMMYDVNLEEKLKRLPRPVRQTGYLLLLPAEVREFLIEKRRHR